jgi:hypothetical protein
MAALALLPKATLMNVTLLVTPYAGSRSTDFVRIKGLLVAIEALCLLVRTIHLVLGPLVMVEIPCFPVARIVTAVALSAQTQLVLVFLLVAGVTIRLGVLEFRRFVAFLALGLDMLAKQREFRLIVIKPDVIALPALFIVAILALLAQLAVMLVVLFVAGVTV